ncbi:MAG: fumarate hydratase [Candidatus Omnitrophota bacterium]|nr:fumarate hydratase [Candidatus Omnitrophota bacterium]
MRKQIENMVAEANFSLRADVLRLLRKAHSQEKEKKAKKALSWILENAKIAKKERLAICQDTGFPVIFIEVGKSISINDRIIGNIEEGIISGYRKNCLRPSIIDPLRRAKSSYKGGASHIDFSSKVRGIKVTLLPKGFGSENKTQLKMFNPTVTIKDIEEFIVESAKEAGPEACPPFIVGVGIGGTSDSALLLAKKALIERVDKPNKNYFINGLEKKLLKKINALNIGPMGLGGKHTCLAVKVKTVPTHIAGLPVGVNISCHALRSAIVNIKV